MIGVPGENGAGAIKLFQHHHAHELMRPGRRPEGELELGAFAQALRKPIGAADDETSRWTVFAAPLLQQGRERCAVEILASLVEDRDYRAFGNDIGDGDRFLGAPPLDILSATFADFDDLDFTKPEAAPDRFGALAVVRGKLSDCSCASPNCDAPGAPIAPPGR